MSNLNRIVITATALAALLCAAGSTELAQTQFPQPAAERTAVIAEWESLKYGMFIHFGLSTFMLEGYGKKAEASCADYRPTQLDVDQWARVANDAGMKYAVLTTKHCYGHGLWPGRHSDRSVAQSPVKHDVVKLFAEACRKHEIKPGFYYLLGWDNYHQPRGTQPPDNDLFLRSRRRGGDSCAVDHFLVDFVGVHRWSAQKGDVPTRPSLAIPPTDLRQRLSLWDLAQGRKNQHGQPPC